MEENLTKEFLGNFKQGESDFRSYIFSIVRNEVEMENILQDAYLKMIEKKDSYDNTKLFTPWAMGFIIMQIRRWRQKLGREKLVFADDTIELMSQTAIDEFSSREIDIKENNNSIISDILLGISKINPKYAEIIKMKYFDNLESKEIAKRLNINEGSVEMSLTRGRRELKNFVLNQ